MVKHGYSDYRESRVFPVRRTPDGHGICATHCAQPELERLFYAAEEGVLGTATTMIKDNGAPVDAFHPYTGLTPMMVAAQSGKRSLVRLLLEHKARVDLVSPIHRHTALSLSVLGSLPVHFEIAKMLIEHGASMWFPYFTGIASPLWISCGASGVLKPDVALYMLSLLTKTEADRKKLQEDPGWATEVNRCCAAVLDTGVPNASADPTHPGLAVLSAFVKAGFKPTDPVVRKMVQTVLLRNDSLLQSQALTATSSTLEAHLTAKNASDISRVVSSNLLAGKVDIDTLVGPLRSAAMGVVKAAAGAVTSPGGTTRRVSSSASPSLVAENGGVSGASNEGSLRFTSTEVKARCELNPLSASGQLPLVSQMEEREQHQWVRAMLSQDRVVNPLIATAKALALKELPSSSLEADSKFTTSVSLWINDPVYAHHVANVVADSIGVNDPLATALPTLFQFETLQTEAPMLQIIDTTQVSESIANVFKARQASNDHDVSDHETLTQPSPYEALMMEANDLVAGLQVPKSLSPPASFALCNLILRYVLDMILRFGEQGFFYTPSHPVNPETLLEILADSVRSICRVAGATSRLTAKQLQVVHHNDAVVYLPNDSEEMIANLYSVVATPLERFNINIFDLNVPIRRGHDGQQLFGEEKKALLMSLVSKSVATRALHKVALVDSQAAASRVIDTIFVQAHAAGLTIDLKNQPGREPSSENPVESFISVGTFVYALYLSQLLRSGLALLGNVLLHGTGRFMRSQQAGDTSKPIDRNFSDPLLTYLSNAMASKHAASFVGLDGAHAFINAVRVKQSTENPDLAHSVTILGMLQLVVEEIYSFSRPTLENQRDAAFASLAAARPLIDPSQPHDMFEDEWSKEILERGRSQGPSRAYATSSLASLHRDRPSLRDLPKRPPQEENHPQIETPKGPDHLIQCKAALDVRHVSNRIHEQDQLLREEMQSKLPWMPAQIEPALCVSSAQQHALAVFKQFPEVQLLVAAVQATERPLLSQLVFDLVFSGKASLRELSQVLAERVVNDILPTTQVELTPTTAAVAVSKLQQLGVISSETGTIIPSQNGGTSRLSISDSVLAARAQLAAIAQAVLSEFDSRRSLAPQGQEQSIGEAEAHVLIHLLTHCVSIAVGPCVFSSATMLKGHSTQSLSRAVANPGNPGGCAACGIAPVELISRKLKLRMLLDHIKPSLLSDATAAVTLSTSDQATESNAVEAKEDALSDAVTTNLSNAYTLRPSTAPEHKGAGSSTTSARVQCSPLARRRGAAQPRSTPISLAEAIRQGHQALWKAVGKSMVNRLPTDTPAKQSPAAPRSRHLSSPALSQQSLRSRQVAGTRRWRNPALLLEGMEFIS